MATSSNWQSQRTFNGTASYQTAANTYDLRGRSMSESFCQVDKGHAPMPIDTEEPMKVAEAVKLLGLRYVVLTSVARDDLPDQGAGHFVQTMAKVRELNPGTQIEVLTPDFYGDTSRIEMIASSKPACFNHNIETVRRLTGRVRRGAKYDRSLSVLQTVKDFDPMIPTKSGLMLGHGETRAEVIETMADLRVHQCNRITLGQYMRPSLEHLPVQKYWTPAEFDELGNIAREMGFSHVRSGPLVRSSYHAGE
jgi:lipoyl synthase